MSSYPLKKKKKGKSKVYVEFKVLPFGSECVTIICCCNLLSKCRDLWTLILCCKSSRGQVWWCILVRWRLEDQGFKAILNYIVSS